MSSDYYDLKVEDVKFHEMAEEHPLQTEAVYASMKRSIELSGQALPIITYRGKIVDGRHRVKAIIEIGSINIIKASRLPNNMTTKEVRELVLGVEFGNRAPTSAQKAIKAMLYGKATGLKDKDIIAKFGTNSTNLNHAKKIYNEHKVINGKDNGCHCRVDLIMNIKEKGFCMYNGFKYDSIAKLRNKLDADNKPEVIPDKRIKSDALQIVIDASVELTDEENMYMLNHFKQKIQNKLVE